MAEKKSIAEIVGRLPDPDENGMLSRIDKAVVDGVVTEVLAGGRDVLDDLIGMLVEPGKGDDWKARYALHCLAVHVCRLDDDNARRRFARALASRLGGDTPKGVQKYLIQELQVAGGRGVVARLGEALLDDELCEDAAMALVAIGDGAAEQFRKALPKVSGKSKLTVVQNLGVVRDVQSVDALRQALRDDDREVRLAAGWGLANIGEAGSVDLLIEAADAKDGYERIQATKSCLLLAERLAAAGNRNVAVKVYEHLRRTRKESDETYVCEAAEAGLARVR
jgi:hypothetical protein